MVSYQPADNSDMKRATPILIPITVVLIASFSLLHFPRTELPQSAEKSLSQVRDAIGPYAAWHAEQRRCLNNGRCSPPLLVWQCPQHKVEKCAGLGDRMRGIQFALLLAILTRRVLLLDWPADPFEIQAVMQPAAIDWTIPSKRMPTDLILDWYSCNPGNICANGTNRRFPSVEHLPLTTTRRNGRLRDMNLLEDNVQKRLQSFKRVSITQRFEWRTTRQLLQTHNSRNDSAMFADLCDVQLQRALTNALFEPSESVKRRMNKFDLLGTKYAAVHVRTGEDFKEADGRFRKVLENETGAAKQVVREMKGMLQRHQNVSSNVIYVASDSHHFKQRLRKVAKQEGMGVQSVENQALHIAKIGLKHEKVRSEKHLRDMFVDVFVDLFMLSGAQVLLGSGSGFSNAAWMLGKGEEYVRVKL